MHEFDHYFNRIYNVYEFYRNQLNKLPFFLTFKFVNTRSTMLNVFILCSILQHLSRTEQKNIFCSDSYNISLTGNLYFLYLIDIFYRWCFDHGDLTYQNWDKISCKCLCSKLLNSNKQGFNISSWAYFFLLNLKLPKF